MVISQNLTFSEISQVILDKINSGTIYKEKA